MKGKDGYPKDVCRFPDGAPIVVLRPQNPAISMAFAQVAVRHQSEEALKEAVCGQPTVCVGFLVRRNGKMFSVDNDGNNAKPLEQGDILTDPDSCTPSTVEDGVTVNGGVSEKPS